MIFVNIFYFWIFLYKEKFRETKMNTPNNICRRNEIDTGIDNDVVVPNANDQDQTVDVVSIPNDQNQDQTGDVLNDPQDVVIVQVTKYFDNLEELYAAGSNRNDQDQTVDVLNDQLDVLNDQPDVLNDQQDVLNDQPDVLNDQQEF